MLIYDHKAHGALTRVTASKVEYIGVSVFSTGHWALGADFSLDHVCFQWSVLGRAAAITVFCSELTPLPSDRLQSLWVCGSFTYT